jgi:2-hydroxychromene-2-carboxylate isomerase
VRGLSVLRVVSYTLYHSSNAYLGHFLAARSLGDLPVELERRPLHVPKTRGIWVSDLVGGRASPRQGDYNREDCLRWAARHGIEMRFAPSAELAARVARWKQQPLAREELAARAYYGVLGTGREAALDAALFRASYVDLADVNDEAVVRRACETAGLEPDAVLRRAFEPDATQRLEQALAEFDRLECPGTPTFVVDGERFWGKDRVDWMVEAVKRRLDGD